MGALANMRRVANVVRSGCRALHASSALSINTVSMTSQMTRSAPSFQVAAMAPRMFCSNVTVTVPKDQLLEAFREVGAEARKVMLETEDRFRKEVDEKADGGMDLDMCASMYGHQMAGFMAEFVPTRPDSVVNNIRDRILADRGIDLDDANRSLELLKNDHEVQVLLTTMYQHQLDEVSINADLTIDKYVELTKALQESCCDWIKRLHKNLDGKSSPYGTKNQKMQLEQARMAVPSIAIFCAQYTVLRTSGFGHLDKLVADLLYSVWPQAQQANAMMHQAINDTNLAAYTPDEEIVQELQNQFQAQAQG